MTASPSADAAGPDPARHHDAQGRWAEGREATEVRCRLPFFPVILVTAKVNPKDVMTGLDAGGDDYLSKPVSTAHWWRGACHVAHQGSARRGPDAERGSRGQGSGQVEELERWGICAGFWRPGRPAVVSAGDEAMLISAAATSWRCSAICAASPPFRAAEPEDVMSCSRGVAAVGPLIHRYEGTLERFLGDDMMVLFNAPLPYPTPRAGGTCR